jgi:hypothetical protein
MFEAETSKLIRSVTFFVLLLLLMPEMVQAQHVKKERKRPRMVPWTIDDRFSASLTPSSFIDPYGALCPVGLGYYFGNRYSIHIEAGLPLYYVLNNYAGNPRKTVNSDFKVRAAIQQYFLLKERNRCFFGAESSYRRQEMYLQHSYLRYINGMSYDYTGINAVKTIYCLGAYVGTSHKLSERFMLDAHLGLGLRILNMETDFNPAGLNPVKRGTFSSLVPPNEDRVGERDINMYLPFAIKIAYLL